MAGDNFCPTSAHHIIAPREWTRLADHSTIGGPVDQGGAPGRFGSRSFFHGRESTVPSFLRVEASDDPGSAALDGPFMPVAMPEPPGKGQRR